MKSQQDFANLDQYRDYLRDYYAGMIFFNLLYTQEFPERDARIFSTDLVKELYGDWT